VNYFIVALLGLSAAFSLFVIYFCPVTEKNEEPTRFSI